MKTRAMLTNKSLPVLVTDNNIHIENSYQYRKRDFEEVLDRISYWYPDNNVQLHRSKCSLKLEWAAHNFLYRLNFERARTKDVDLDWPQKYSYQIFYAIFGCIAWLFIK